eukprot:UN14396
MRQQQKARQLKIQQQQKHANFRQGKLIPRFTQKTKYDGLYHDSNQPTTDEYNDMFSRIRVVHVIIMVRTITIQRVQNVAIIQPIQVIMKNVLVNTITIIEGIIHHNIKIFIVINPSFKKRNENITINQIVSKTKIQGTKKAYF